MLPKLTVTCISKINPLKPSGYYIYHPLYHTKTLHSADSVYLCVPYGSHNKQRLFPQTALTGWALRRRRNVFPVRYELKSYISFEQNSVFKGLSVWGHRLFNIFDFLLQGTDIFVFVEKNGLCILLYVRAFIRFLTLRYNFCIQSGRLMGYAQEMKKVTKPIFWDLAWEFPIPNERSNTSSTNPQLIRHCILCKI
jgi:hypothetical protein